MTSARPRRGGRSLAAVWMVAILMLAGCYSHEERWGRDPEKFKASDASPSEKQRIEVARAHAIEEETQPASGTEDDALTPAPVLFINGDPLTVEDILKWMRPELRDMAAAIAPADYQNRLMERLRDAIRSRAESELLVQEARKSMAEQEIERLEQFVDGRIRELINTEHGGRESRYHESLRQRGITPTEDRARMTREILVAAFLQRTIGQKVAEPTRREIEQFHHEYVASLQAKQKRRMLLIDLPHGAHDATGREVSAPVARADALQRGRRALAKLQAGEDFRAIAREYSEGINNYNGGDWGWITRDGVKPRWQPAVDALYDLAEGATSDLIETPEAVFIVRCDEMEPLEIPSFTALQPQLIEAYKARQFDVMTRELLVELHTSADIRPANPGRFLLAVMAAAPQPGRAGQ